MDTTFRAGHPRKKVPSRLDPREVIRAVVLVQAAVRRWLVDDCRRLLDIQPTMPSPPLAVALAFAHRLLHPEAIDIESEAMSSAAIICGREYGLTLGPIVASFREYQGKLPDADPVFELLMERFTEVATEMDEDVLAKVSKAKLPSEARAMIEQGRHAWGAPAESLVTGYKLFASCQDWIHGLNVSAESMFNSRLEHCATRRSIAALEADVDVEFGHCHTPLRARLLRVKLSHKERMELEVQTNFGWPPKSAVSRLGPSLRWFAHELGDGHRLIEDFLAASRRALWKAEAAAEKELKPIDETAQEMRRRLTQQPSPPKLIFQAVKDELDELLRHAEDILADWHEELVYESPKVLKRVCSILGRQVFLQRVLAEAAEVAQELRRLGPAYRAEAEEPRQRAACRLWQLVEIMQAEGALMPATEYSVEFDQDLTMVRRFICLLRSDLVAFEMEEDDGWHRPLGFQPAVCEGKTPPPTPPRQPTPEPTPRVSTPRADISICMKLHSVSEEDTKAKSQILLMERCAAIIAQ
ncbi:unnamed protein product, partial [Polarella glacialis]